MLPALTTGLSGQLCDSRIMKYNSSMVTAPTTEILNNILDPVTDCLTPEVAQKILAVRLDPRVQARLDELAEKANEGLLTDVEREEYALYIEALDLVAIVKAKARAALSISRTAAAE